METELVNKFQEIVNSANVTGCVLSGPQGLSMMSTSNLKPEVSGVVLALSQHAAKLENSDYYPIISLESDTRTCLILNEEGYTTAIFKKNSSQS